VYRSEQSINTETRLKEAEKLTTAVDIGEYVDDKISASGTYYYAVTVKALKGKENPSLVPDANFTVNGLPINIKLANPIKLKSISARIEKSGVLVSWKISGEQGTRSYRLFRTEKLLKKMNEVSSRDILLNVDINDKQYIDKAPMPGKYYYGLLPGTIGAKDTGNLIPGVNITRLPLKIKGKEEKGPIEPDDIDRILKKTFFKGNYHGAIKALQDLLNSSDNEEVAAKAKLFIGRSHIELGRYQKALDYLILSDVKKFYPKEADFWLAFALTRIKNY
jgi:tetratricopeptide (TPR) repeat protein